MFTGTQDTRHALNNGRPTLGILVGTLTSEYHEGIMRGADYVAAEKNYNVIGFSGGVIDSTDLLTLTREKVFDLVDTDMLSGVISPFSSHMRFLDKQARQHFLDRFANIPVVNIGSKINGFSNVLTNYDAGFTELFEHFHNDHGYRKIILVRGPKHHASSNKRMEIFKALLKKYQLPFDEEMVIYSNLKRDASQLKFEAFIDHSNKEFDAVITVNDNQAFGVMDACKERGIRLPEDVAVAGSMNTLEGAFSTPSLSGVAEPLFELGRIAAIELIAQIEGQPRTDEIHIPTSLIIRQSCGCAPTSHHVPYQMHNHISTTPFSIDDHAIFEETQAYFGNIVEQSKGGIVREDIASAIALYQQALYDKNFDGFLLTLQSRLEDALKSEDILLWFVLTDKLQLSALRYLNIYPDAHVLIKFVAQLITLKSEIEQIAIKFQRFETEYYLNYFRAIVNNLNSSFDLTTIKKYTVDILQLSELYISLYDDVDTDVVMATNMVAVCNNEFINVDKKSFSAKTLLPDDIAPYKNRFTLIVFPLSFRDTAIGFMTLNLSNRRGAAFENLRAIISSALKNEILIQDLKSAEERFSDIAHSTSNWLWETDQNNVFTYCSNSSADIIGYSAKELVGTSINEFNIEGGDIYINNMNRHEDLTEFECWYLHQNGNVICLLISASCIRHQGEFIGYRGIFEDITEQKLQGEKIKHLAYSDVLTGLPNRTAFQEQLMGTIASSTLNNNKFALMFIDLDHFKHINDTMGHAVGDLLLIKLSERLSKSIRSNDLLARLGGDEFVIILPEIIEQADIIEVAQRIFSSIKEPVSLQGKSVHSTLSIGVSIFPTDGCDAQVLLQKGDNAMYQAKSQGRNGYVFYDKALEEKNALRNAYIATLREAINTKRFIVHYQAQVSVETGTVLGFEALVRIGSSGKGLVAPDNFIPLAEELGLINQIDEWVFDAVCNQYAKWRESGLNNTRLSINLSTLQLRNSNVLDSYIKIIEYYGVLPNDIQFEITENALIENEDLALTILQGFKNYGVSIALDDFGTGYSSLNCINLYPIDTIKIDRSFIKDAIDNPKNKAIIQGIVLIASSLNLKIIAEGVETKEQYDLIKQLGCHEIQGYYFHKPCRAEDAQVMLK